MANSNPYREAFPQPVREAFDACRQLPERPGVAAAIIELARDPSATLVHFAQSVAHDARIEETLLNLANTPLYGRGREAENLRQAISLLGLNQTLNMSLSASLLRTLRKPPPGAELNYNLFWRRALTTAAAARRVAERVPGVHPPEAYLAGMLCDTGMIAIDAAFPAVYSERYQADHLATRRNETATLGIDHSAVGAWLLLEWGLPEHVARGVAGHHGAEALQVCDPGMELAAILATADAVTDVFWDASSVLLIEELSRIAYQSLGIGTATLLSILEKVADETIQTASIFGINIGDVERFEKAITAATAELQSHEPLRDFRLEITTTLKRARGIHRDDSFESLEPVLREEFDLANAQGWPFTVLYIAPKQTDANEGLREALHLQLVANTRESDFVARCESGSLAIMPAYTEEAADIIVRRVFEATSRSRFDVRAVCHSRAHAFDSFDSLLAAVMTTSETEASA